MHPKTRFVGPTPSKMVQSNLLPDCGWCGLEVVNGPGAANSLDCLPLVTRATHLRGKENGYNVDDYLVEDSARHRMQGTIPADHAPHTVSTCTAHGKRSNCQRAEPSTRVGTRTLADACPVAGPVTVPPAPVTGPPAPEI